MPERTPRGLFVGLTTLDVVQLVERLPAPDEKIRALDDMLAAGGPATNAAVGFAAAGGHPTLLTRAADGPAWQLMAADLAACGVEVLRAPVAPGREVTVASILVTTSTGERAVVSAQDRAHLTAETPPDPAATVDAIDVRDFDVVELDGHEADLAATIARRAREAGVPVVLDGGSWKPTTPGLLPHVDVAAVSSAFRPEGAETPDDVLAFLLDHGVRVAAVTRGPSSILLADAHGSRKVEVDRVSDVVDTLGAGDFFYAGLAHHVAVHGLEGIDDALRAGSRLAGRSIRSFGTRRWLA